MILINAETILEESVSQQKVGIIDMPRRML